MLMSMGDVLPAKRQTVVERLKRRFEVYRRHQNNSQPRYEQAANGLYEAQRQETLLLKQRFLESKAKKAKTKSDHHRSYKDSISESKSQLNSKSLKRLAEDPPPAATEISGNEDTDKAKIPRIEAIPENKHIPDLSAKQPNQANLPPFSVPIGQRFTQSPLNQQSSQALQSNVQPILKQHNSPLPQSSQISCGSNTRESSSTPGQDDASVRSVISGGIECKQEKDTIESDLCQFKASQTSSGSGGDRLSDTFPSLEFTDESGENVLHPDILNDLIEDVFTNSADININFNFEDSVSSIKDQDYPAKDLSDLVKGPSPGQQGTVQSDPLSFVNSSSSQRQQNELFRNISSSRTEPSMSSSVSTSASSTFFNANAQRLPPSYGSSSISLPDNLGLDFKMNEPSPAALTLKQMAEQHQNMQQKQQQTQQQIPNPALNTRQPSFSQDNFTPHMNLLRSPNYLNSSQNSSISNNSPKIPSTGSTIFNTFDQRINFSSSDVMSTFQQSCEPLSPNGIFEPRSQGVVNDSNHRSGMQIKLPGYNVMEQQQQHQPETTTYSATRPLTHYVENATVKQNVAMNQQRPLGRQYQNANLRMQMNQVQHIQSRQHDSQQLQQDLHEVKQQQHMVQNPSNVYGNYASQQHNNPAFHVSMPQPLSYSSHFNANSNISRPPPEYKAPIQRPIENLSLVEQLNTPSQMMFNPPAKSKYGSKQQRPPNVTITPDGSAVSASHDWRNLSNHHQQTQYRVGSFSPQDSYPDMNTNIPQNANMPLSPIYNQYRVPQVAPNRSIMRPNMQHLMMQPRQQKVVGQQRLRNPNMQHNMNNLSMGNVGMPQNSIGSMFGDHQDMERQDGSHISLEFLDNIESSASDLLNFEVMQGINFPSLDDIDILGK